MIRTAGSRPRASAPTAAASTCRSRWRTAASDRSRSTCSSEEGRAILAPAARDRRRVPHELPARRAAPTRTRRGDVDRAVPEARLRAWARLRRARARRRPSRLRRVRRSGPAAAWRTCSPRRTATSPSASGARWATATAPWRWRSGWRPRCSAHADAPAGLGRRRVAARPPRCGRCRRTCSPRSRASSRARSSGGARSSNPLVATYRTKDGRHISLVFLEADRYWADFCRLMDRQDLADDPRFVDLAGARRARARHASPSSRPSSPAARSPNGRTLLAQHRRAVGTGAGGRGTARRSAGARQRLHRRRR